MIPYTFGTTKEIRDAAAITKENRMIAFNICENLFSCIPIVITSYSN